MTAPGLRDLAEDAYAYLPVQQHVRRLEFQDHVLRSTPVNIPEGVAVLRIRSTDAGLPALLEKTRAWVRENDRVGALWWTGPSSTPTDLGERLQAEGLRPYEADPVFAGMTYEGEPPEVDGVEVRAVETPADVEVFLDVAQQGWGVPDEVDAQMRASVRQNWPLRDPTLDTLWVAFVDGAPVGNAISQYVGDALYLGGSTVVPESRGRGVYRALLRRRWEDARQHGAKAMVIQAGALSRPVVERIGFEHVCDVRVYVDLV